MFVSKLTLDPQDAQARRDLGDVYEMHRTLARAFAPDESTPPARFLWRLERANAGVPSTTVLVQGDTPGRWERLTCAPTYFVNLQANKAVDEADFIQAGGQHRFRLLANATVTRNGARHGLVKEVDQLAWLTRQGDQFGFTVQGCEVTDAGRIHVRQGSSANRITLTAVLFDGSLTVTDPARTREAIARGLGRGKAFGLGLLSLARASGGLAAR
jgi:CRISPR system Cascade subunit CasE